MRTFVLAILMVLSLVPGAAFAAEDWCQQAEDQASPDVTCRSTCNTPRFWATSYTPTQWICETFVTQKYSNGDTGRASVWVTTMDPSEAASLEAFCPSVCSCIPLCAASTQPILKPCHESYCTPVVIALGNTFHFTGTDVSVAFDLDADGDLESTSWAAGDQGTALLFLDRNGNDRVDDGRELFGGATPQPVSDEPANGYAALRVFDRPDGGGDGDGYLSSRDSIYPSLGLWLDRNRDGVSQPDELTTLAAQGIELIDLHPVESNRRDEHGNQLRWTSHVRFARGWRPAGADVIFLTTP
jgi:hypothetical protein